MHTTLPRLSTEYRRVDIGPKNDLGILANPTTDTVFLAFISQGVQPVDDDWTEAEWETSESVFVDERGWSQPISSPYKVRLLIGPNGGAVDLDVGTWDIWVKIVDNPETIVRKVGVITIVGEEEGS